MTNSQPFYLSFLLQNIYRLRKRKEEEEKAVDSDSKWTKYKKKVWKNERINRKSVTDVATLFILFLITLISHINCALAV